MKTPAIFTTGRKPGTVRATPQSTPDLFPHRPERCPAALLCRRPLRRQIVELGKFSPAPLYTAPNDRAVLSACRWHVPDADHWLSPPLGLCANGPLYPVFCRQGCPHPYEPFSSRIL